MAAFGQKADACSPDRACPLLQGREGGSGWEAGGVSPHQSNPAAGAEVRPGAGLLVEGGDAQQALVLATAADDLK